MAISDYISSACDSLKQNAPDRTAVTRWCSTYYGSGSADATKIDKRINPTQYMPAVKDWCSISYGYGSAAVTKIDNTVRMYATQCMPDEEARSRIGRFGADLAKAAAVYGVQEALKTIPGGTAVYSIVLQALRNQQKFEGHEVKTRHHKPR